MKATLFRQPIMLLAAIAVASCSSDSYETGDTSYSYMQADLCEAAVGSDCSARQIILDNGAEWTLAEAVKTEWMEHADTLYRAIAYYNKVENSQGEPRLEIVSLQQVQVVEPMGIMEMSRLATDAVDVVSLWKGSNGKYLNFRIRLKTGSADDATAAQSLAVVETGRTTSGEATMSHLTLHHSQGGVPEYYSKTIIFSLPIASIAADSVTVSINTYDGTFSRKFSCAAADNIDNQ